MKKIIHFLAFALLITVIGSALYIFDLPPFKKENIIENTDTENQKKTETGNLPTFLQGIIQSRYNQLMAILCGIMYASIVMETTTITILLHL